MVAEVLSETTVVKKRPLHLLSERRNMNSNQNQTLYEIIDVVERIRRLDRVIDEKEAAVTELTAAAETEVGYKRTITNCRLRETQAALDAAIAEYNDLGASIPAPDELLCGYSIGRIADLRIKRGDLLRERESHGQRLVAEEEKLKSGPWRRKGAALPPAILEIQSRIANVDLAVERVDAEIADLMKSIHKEEGARAEKRVFDTWMADETGEVAPPACVVEREKEEREEFIRTAVRLEIVTPAVIQRRAAENRAAAEEAARVAAEEAAWIAEDNRWKARQARAAAKQKEFFARLIAANKRAAALQQQAPHLVVEECA